MDLPYISISYGFNPGIPAVPVPAIATPCAGAGRRHLHKGAAGRYKVTGV